MLKSLSDVIKILNAVHLSKAAINLPRQRFLALLVAIVVVQRVNYRDGVDRITGFMAAAGEDVADIVYAVHLPGDGCRSDVFGGAAQTEKQVAA